MLILIVILLTSIWVQIIYWCAVIGTRPDVRSIGVSNGTDEPMISVIVAYRNEEDTIMQCVQSLLYLEYTNYEIIAIDDHSTDRSYEILQSLSVASDKRLRLLQNPNEPGKKEALTYAIAQAKGIWIALTDADCVPASRYWLQRAMNQGRQDDVLLGYGQYRSHEGWLNRLIRYETWLIGLQYSGLLRYGIRYMAVGRNLFFKKKIFDQIGGYSSHADMMSGMDDLFVRDLPPDVSVSVLTHPDTYTIAEPKRTWGELIHQKARHVTTSVRYDWTVRLILMMISISHLAVYVSMIGLSWVYGQWTLVIVVWSLRSVMMIWSARRAQRVLYDDMSMILVPILDILLLVYYIIISFTYLRPVRRW